VPFLLRRLSTPAHRASIFATVVLAAALVTGPASAMDDAAGFSGENCLAHDELVTYLASAHEEVRTASGEMANGNAMEMFSSGHGSWTLVEIRDDGFACIHASGAALKQETPKRPAVADGPTWNRAGQFRLE
jgi:hypothetical protein